jgi:hypothetical protein
MYNFKRLIDEETRCFCDYLAVIDKNKNKNKNIIIYYAIYDLKKPLGYRMKIK